MPSKQKRAEVTELLSGAKDTPKAAMAERLMPLVYDELRAVAKKLLEAERAGHTLQPTALVNEVYLHLVDQSRVDWQGRTHFFAVGATMMRRILIDHTRTKRRHKRGGQWRRVALEDALIGAQNREVDFSDLNAALDELAGLDPEQACIVELRFFGGLTVDEVASLLGVSKRKVEGEWTHARAWLKSRLAGTAER